MYEVDKKEQLRIIKGKYFISFLITNTTEIISPINFGIVPPNTMNGDKINILISNK